MPEESEVLHAFLQELVNPAPAPILPLPPAPEPEPEQLRCSERLSNKPTANLASVDKARMVLMKKLDIHDEAANTQEVRKQRLLNMFKGPAPPEAVEAMEDLLSDVTAETSKMPGLPAAV